MFLVNSRLNLFTVPAYAGPLIPKLRGQFAEFLNEGYLERLRVFLPHTCVGLRYGRLISSLRGSFSAMDLLIFSLPKQGSLTARMFIGQAFNSPHPHCFDEHPTVRISLPIASPLHSIRRLLINNRIPIGYAFRPHLRGRLTLGRIS